MPRVLFDTPDRPAEREAKRSGRKRRIGLILAIAMAVVLPAVTMTRANADAPNLVSKNGITVSATRWISSRTIEADISTALIAPVAVNGPHRIRITLPNDYF